MHPGGLGSPHRLLVGEALVAVGSGKALLSLWVLVRVCPQEVNTLRRQLGDKLRIELDAVPTMDLGTVLEETRCLYEAMVETHRRDGKQWFQAQVRTQLRSGERPGFCSGSVS